MNVLIACEESGIVRDEFIRMGHYAMSCDLQPTARPGPHYQGDVRDVLDAGWDMMIAHPPCPRLTNTAVRWLHVPPPGKTLEQMWTDMFAAIDFYLMLRDAKIKMKVLENPIMHKYAMAFINIGVRQFVQPWWFGDPAFKATGFELINMPPLVPTNKLTPPKPGTPEHKKWSYIFRMPPGPHRAKMRSRTFPGIARAMAQQWGATS